MTKLNLSSTFPLFSLIRDKIDSLRMKIDSLLGTTMYEIYILKFSIFNN